MSDKELDSVLKTVDPARRAALRKLIVGAAFTAPVVTSFTLDGSPLIGSALAAVSNTTSS